MREFLKLPRQPHCVAGVPGLERGQFHFGLLLVVQGPRASAFVLGGGEGAGVINAHGAFSHGHDAEVGSAPAATLDGLGNLLDAVGDFRNQNNIGAACDAGAKCQPARAMSHDFGDDDAMVAVRRAVKPINRISRDVQSGGEAKG